MKINSENIHKITNVFSNIDGPIILKIANDMLVINSINTETPVLAGLKATIDNPNNETGSIILNKNFLDILMMMQKDSSEIDVRISEQKIKLYSNNRSIELSGLNDSNLITVNFNKIAKELLQTEEYKIEQLPIFMERAERVSSVSTSWLQNNIWGIASYIGFDNKTIYFVSTDTNTMMFVKKMNTDIDKHIDLLVPKNAIHILNMIQWGVNGSFYTNNKFVLFKNNDNNLIAIVRKYNLDSYPPILTMINNQFETVYSAKINKKLLLNELRLLSIAHNVDTIPLPSRMYTEGDIIRIKSITRQTNVDTQLKTAESTGSFDIEFFPDISAVLSRLSGDILNLIVKKYPHDENKFLFEFSNHDKNEILLLALYSSKNTVLKIKGYQ